MFDIFVYLLLAVVMLLLIAFFYIRDKSIFKRLEAYERAIDDLHTRVYRLESGGVSSSEYDQKELLSSLGKVEERFESKIDELGEPLLRAIRAIKRVEENLTKTEARIDEKIVKIEESLKPATRKDSSKETRVIKLHNDGLTIEEIAQRERLPQREVEFIIKMSKLR